jgi:hypothetical protein
MACSKTICLAGQDWPLYRTTDSGKCCYKIVANDSSIAAEVAADAESKPDYDSQSEFFPTPDGKIQFYVYFGPACGRDLRPN